MVGVSSPARPQYVQYFNSPECSLSLLPHPSYHNMVVIPLMPNIPLKRLVQALSCFIGTFRVRGLHNKFCDDFFLFDAHADLYLRNLFVLRTLCDKLCKNPYPLLCSRGSKIVLCPTHNFPSIHPHGFGTDCHIKYGCMMKINDS